MQGNRATQKSGLVNAFCLFHISDADLGDGVLPFSLTVYTLGPFSPQPTPQRPLSNVFLSLITTVSQPSHRTWFPPCFFARLPILCCLSLCKCVSGSLPPLHITVFPPFICGSTVRLIKHPLSFSVGLLGHEQNGRSLFIHLTSFSRGQHIRHAHVPFVYALVYIPRVRLRHNAIRLMRRDEKCGDVRVFPEPTSPPHPRRQLGTRPFLHKTSIPPSSSIAVPGHERPPSS